MTQYILIISKLYFKVLFLKISFTMKSFCFQCLRDPSTFEKNLAKFILCNIAQHWGIIFSKLYCDWLQIDWQYFYCKGNGIAFLKLNCNLLQRKAHISVIVAILNQHWKYVETIETIYHECNIDIIFGPGYNPYQQYGFATKR